MVQHQQGACADTARPQYTIVVSVLLPLQTLAGAYSNGHVVML
jgi:hypothetical protein